MAHFVSLLASAIDLSPLPDISGSQSTFITDAIQIVIGIVGALSFLFIVIGGLRYILSQGDPQGVSKAKGTIIYALIGLAVAILAQIIVTFVVEAIK